MHSQIRNFQTYVNAHKHRNKQENMYVHVENFQTRMFASVDTPLLVDLAG